MDIEWFRKDLEQLIPYRKKKSPSNKIRIDKTPEFIRYTKATYHTHFPTSVSDFFFHRVVTTNSVIIHYDRKFYCKHFVKFKLYINKTSEPYI